MHNLKSSYLIRLSSLGLIALLSAACETQDNEPSSAEQPPQPILTYQGPVQGQWTASSAEVEVYRGIPYAKPPRDELRWRAPSSLAARSTTYDASHFRPACWQAPGSDNFVWARGDFERSEDCLYLNIWRPSAGANRAVMVWFHGGAHTGGMSHDLIFDGTQIARQDVILVSVNYRLGPLGFLALPELASESSHNSAGNYGLLDKIAALNWISENIAQFGGDPKRITVFGQSAGSQSVCTLMASPLARGLFQRAIGQSASCVSALPLPDANGFERGRRLAAALGVNAGPDSLAALRQAAADDLLQAARASDWSSRSRITVDGWVLPDTPEAIYGRGEQMPVALLAGTLANEGHRLIPVNRDLDLATLTQTVRTWAGEHTGALLDAYAADDDPPAAYHALLTDLLMTYGARRWLQYQERRAPGQNYLYFMDHVPPAFRLYRPAAPQLDLPAGPRSAGAYHSGDLAFVFGNTHTVGVGWEAEDHALSELMLGYWTNFAKSGNPNGEGLPHWPNFDAQTQATQRLNARTQNIEGAQRERLDLIDAALPMSHRAPPTGG